MRAAAHQKLAPGSVRACLISSGPCESGCWVQVMRLPGQGVLVLEGGRRHGQSGSWLHPRRPATEKLFNKAERFRLLPAT